MTDTKAQEKDVDMKTQAKGKEDKKTDSENKNGDSSKLLSTKESEATGGVEVSENDFLNNLEARVTLSRRRLNSFYLQRARRLLRMFDEIKILGASFDISRACLVVELLKKEETGYIKQVQTRMHLSTNGGQFGEPQPVIEFTIGRGNYGEYLSGFAQRKLIELFEKQVPTTQRADGSETVLASEEKSDKFRLHKVKETYELSKEAVEGLGLDGAFFGDKSKIDQGKKLLDEEASKNDGYVTLPVFIRYASMMVNPRLKNLKFREILNKKYGLNVGRLRNRYDESGDGNGSGRKGKDETDSVGHRHDDDDDDDDHDHHEHDDDDEDEDDTRDID